MECCGYDRTTSFCPMCGKPMNEKPIYGLLRHVKTYMVAKEKDLAVNIRIHGEDGKKIDPSGCDIYREGLKRRLKKWTEWYEALIDLLEKKEPK